MLYYDKTRRYSITRQDISLQDKTLYIITKKDVIYHECFLNTGNNTAIYHTVILYRVFVRILTRIHYIDDTRRLQLPCRLVMAFNLHI